MNTQDIISIASSHLQSLPGHLFDIISISKPPSIDSAQNLSKIISKLSPLVGNLIEFNIVDYLNTNLNLKNIGHWVRQDPGFPDTIFSSEILPTPGFEVKAWFPLATEITARFKDSQNHFIEDQTHVAILAWLPEFVIYGKPKIIDILITSGRSVAAARDNHYHNPPNYVVLEPEDTSNRTKNLQQTNTNGYKFQIEKGDIKTAEKFVETWGESGKKYSTERQYQEQLRELLRKFDFRLDTNFAKMDRIRHSEIEAFKQKILHTKIANRTIKEWTTALNKGNENIFEELLYLKE